MRERFKGLLSFEGSILLLFISTCGSSNVVFRTREYGKYKISQWGKRTTKTDFPN